MNKVIPQCLGCKHRIGGVGIRCPAFDDEMVPAAIILNQHDHREPYPGDHGFRFEPIPGMARTGVPPAAEDE